MKRKPLPRPHLRLPGETSYEIGYCKPPKHTWFKPGQSGNPRGRPKAIKSAGAALNNALKAKVRLRGNGKERGVSSLDAYFIRVVTDAIQGKASAQRLLPALIERFLPTNTDATLTENAEDARDRLLKRIELMAERRQRMPPDEK